MPKGAQVASKGVADELSRYLGGLPEEREDRYRKASPVQYISKFHVPVLAIFGGANMPLAVDQARILVDRMVAVVTGHLEPGTRSGYSILFIPRGGVTPLFSPVDDYPMWSFLDLYLKPNQRIRLSWPHN